jgi:hypothetical protein
MKYKYCGHLFSTKVNDYLKVHGKEACSKQRNNVFYSIGELAIGIEYIS